MSEFEKLQMGIVDLHANTKDLRIRLQEKQNQLDTIRRVVDFGIKDTKDLLFSIKDDLNARLREIEKLIPKDCMFVVKQSQIADHATVMATLIHRIEILESSVDSHKKSMPDVENIYAGIVELRDRTDEIVNKQSKMGYLQEKMKFTLGKVVDKFDSGNEKLPEELSAALRIKQKLHAQKDVGPNRRDIEPGEFMILKNSSGGLVEENTVQIQRLLRDVCEIRDQLRIKTDRINGLDQTVERLCNSSSYHDHKIKGLDNQVEMLEKHRVIADRVLGALKINAQSIHNNKSVDNSELEKELREFKIEVNEKIDHLVSRWGGTLKILLELPTDILRGIIKTE